MTGEETVASERVAVDIGVGICQQHVGDFLENILGHEGIEVVCLRLVEVLRVRLDGVRVEQFQVVWCAVEPADHKRSSVEPRAGSELVPNQSFHGQDASVLEEGLQAIRSCQGTVVLAVDIGVADTHLELGVHSVRRRHEEGLPQVEHLCGTGKLEEEHRGCGEFEQMGGEVRDEPEGRSPAAAQCPEQVRIRRGAGGQRLPVCEDDIHCGQL